MWLINYSSSRCLRGAGEPNSTEEIKKKKKEEMTLLDDDESGHVKKKKIIIIIKKKKQEQCKTLPLLFNHPIAVIKACTQIYRFLLLPGSSFSCLMALLFLFFFCCFSLFPLCVLTEGDNRKKKDEKVDTVRCVRMCKDRRVVARLLLLLLFCQTGEKKKARR